MTTVAIMQPTYLPWCGYFDLIDQADIFVLLDNVEISKQSWQTRNRIRARDGNVVWLSIPVHAHMDQPLNEVRIANERNWRRKHARTLNASYSHAPYWVEIRLTDTCEWLASFTSAVIEAFSDQLGITTKIVPASSLARQRHNPIHRLADICQSVGATEYLSPAGARDYLDGHDIGVPIRWHQYQPAEYGQGGQPWMPYLSVVDALAWNGPNTLDIIRAGRG